MSALYIYATPNCLDILSNSQEKIILIGSDFGYGNFGDILQHTNTVLHSKAQYEGCATISVMAANAIERIGYPEWLQQCYGVDAILFVSEHPLALDAASPALVLVHEIHNVAALHLYGGGFLNHMWGDYILNVASYFLRLAPEIHYFVSGQQITAPYHHRVLEHIKEFQPKAFAVRDDLSQNWLKDIGYSSDFSFDDATEALVSFTNSVQLQKGSGVLVHLNSSNYTSDKPPEQDICNDLFLLRRTVGFQELTLTQAYRDPRHEVLDTTETIKKFGSLLPFHDARLLDLVGLIFSNRQRESIQPVQAGIGYSCSYHVALWLQLAGIPCWLRSENAFYSQKSRALQVTQTFDEFISNPKLADHRLNLERRSVWLERLSGLFQEIPRQKNILKLTYPSDCSPIPFIFKGRTKQSEVHALESAAVQELKSSINSLSNNFSLVEKQISQKLSEAEEQKKYIAEQFHAMREVVLIEGQAKHNALLKESQEKQNQLLNENKVLNDRLHAVLQQSTDIGQDAHKLQYRNHETDALLKGALAENTILNSRIEAMSIQITDIGQEAHRNQMQNEQSMNLLSAMQRSWSWRITKPLRIVLDLIKK